MQCRTGHLLLGLRIPMASREHTHWQSEWQSRAPIRACGLAPSTIQWSGMKTVSLATSTIATVDQGGGLPVILLHGFPLDHTMWDAQIDALSKRHRVIAPDLRGFGQSRLGTIDSAHGI